MFFTAQFQFLFYFFVLFLPDLSLEYLKMTQEFLTAKFGRSKKFLVINDII